MASAGNPYPVQTAMPSERVIENIAIVSAVEDEEVKELRIRGTFTDMQIRTHKFEITGSDKKRCAGKILASASGLRLQPPPKSTTRSST